MWRVTRCGRSADSAGGAVLVAASGVATMAVAPRRVGEERSLIE